MAFRDYFSKQANQYARHRPRYPAAMFDELAGLAPDRSFAWDCGTGNGQAAVALASRFARVVATDGSTEQIEHAFPHERVEYRVERAEATTLRSGSADLVTVGTAVHWFNFDLFYQEVRRVCRAHGVLAVWGYSLPVINPALDAWLYHYARITLAAYWPERIRYLDERYRTLPFPFVEISPLECSMEARWDMDCLVGFLASWSATRRYIEAQGRAPFEWQIHQLGAIWGPPDLSRKIVWPLFFRIGRMA